MSLEIPNPWAVARLDLSNPAVVTQGFGVASVARLSAGNYEVTLVEALDIQQGLGILQPAAGASIMTSVRVRDYTSFGPGNILLQTFDAAGAPVEGGNCVLALFRFPSQPAS